MTKIELILKETDSLNSDELMILVQELLNRIKNSEKAQELISKYRGVGKGVWKEDAQSYVNDSRRDE